MRDHGDKRYAADHGRPGRFMANHSSARTTQPYDRREEEVTVQEIEKVRFGMLNGDVGRF